MLLAIKSLPTNPAAEEDLALELNLLAQQPAPDVNRIVALILSFLTKDEFQILEQRSDRIRSLFFGEVTPLESRSA